MLRCGVQPVRPHIKFNVLKMGGGMVNKIAAALERAAVEVSHGEGGPRRYPGASGSGWVGVVVHLNGGLGLR